MTRINTNVSSSIAQSNLARSHATLQVSLQRLSTGLRINVGKDDPAGLIASEILRSDITSIERAISNSERANQVIATADSALGQVNSLLNDIRGLVSEAANTGALSQEQIEANQLQLDSSLEAIDRIAQTTSFQGRKLLDGSLDFTNTSPGNRLTTATASIAAGATFATATLSATGANNDLLFTARTAGTSANGYTISVTSGATGALINISATATGVQIQISGDITAANIAQALSANATFSGLFSVGNAGADTGLGVINPSAGLIPTTVTAGGGLVGAELLLTAVSAGTGANAYAITFTSGASETATLSGNSFLVSVTAGSTTTTVADRISASGVFTVTISGGATTPVTVSATAINPTGGTSTDNISDLQIDQANFGTQSSIAVEVEIDTQATQGTLTYSGGNLSEDLVLELGGSRGFEVFNFGTGNTVQQIRDAINLVADATGVSASLSGTDLVFRSADFGSTHFVQLRSLSGSFDVFNDTATLTERDAGSDVLARINGIIATGKGLQASINTSTLDINLKVNSLLSAGSTVNFTITGGGANFQLGPDVVSNQQARLGIQGVSTATLGGADGTLFELRTGGAKALATDVKGAALVVDQVITKVTSLRGRLGAFQRTTLESNIVTLTDTLQTLSDAQSAIRDADFAKETANLTRSQILVQAGTTVLSIANQSPQNVLALLQ